MAWVSRTRTGGAARTIAGVLIAAALCVAPSPVSASVHEKPLSTEAACARISAIVERGSGGDPLGFVKRLLGVSAKTKDKMIRREIARVFATTIVIAEGGKNDGGITKGLGNLGTYCGKYE